MKSLIGLLLVSSAGLALAGDNLPLKLRDRVEEDGIFTVRERAETWDTNNTAVIVCDMWDAHHCLNAVQRGEELAPRIDALLKGLRARGALVIHAPSSCMKAYETHPGRKRAIDAPKADNLPEGIDNWLHWIDEREEAAGYPIDHSDGGEDDNPEEHAEWARHLKEEMGRNPRSPWKKQTAGIEIDPDRDAITDSGSQVWNLLRARGANNVLLVGVHTNMCVLGRPFGLRQLAKNGVNVALVRDLTDTMYNPAMPPKVSHFAGTDLVVEHIEKYVCPTVSSEQVLGGSPFAFKGDERPKILFLIGEREYATEETLPRFAAEHLTADYRVQILFAEDGSNDFGDIAAALADADALFVSVRRRALEKRHLEAVRAFVAAGFPVLGIRTASHAFALRSNQAPEGHALWEAFDPEVFGGSYHGHHGNKLKTFAKVAEPLHPICDGLGEEEFATGGSLYKVLPLRDRSLVLLEGRADTIEEKQPVAWNFIRADGGRSFYTSLGQVDDFGRPEFTKLLKNALRWVLQKRGDRAKISAVAPRGRSPDLPEGALSPEASLAQLHVPDDLAVDLMLSEPLIAQPLHLSFDARGRLWVVEYRQYPDPAGLKELSRDKVWRVAYDRMPPPPPHPEGSPFRGKDRISIHEDTDGDGQFDSHKVFADGLNMATSVAHGDGGVWVTNPPYLLFFSDRDGDDVPDGAPEVHLKGFGLEDTHSIANSLTLSPDGWLYGAQGSTVSAAIIRPGIDKQEDAVRSMGQHIWRYHPGTKDFEIFAEGGGNAFGVEVDSTGRVYSGHNGGDTRGFHYIEGGYFQKTWGKHGALTNPHAYGFFPPMKHAKVARFVHQFLIYEDNILPDRYRGKLWGVDILHRNLVLSELVPNGSTFRTEDIERVVRSDDPWFRPVMVTDAPDGSIYVADWYDEQVNHYKNHEGQIDHQRGRVYRVRPKDGTRREFSAIAGRELRGLIEAMNSPARWWRRASLIEFKRRFPDQGSGGVPAMERVWLKPSAGALRSEDPLVRREAVRLAGAYPELVPLAIREQHPEVIAQIAATARRAPTEVGLSIAEAVARRDQFADDPHIPLLVWWAIEHHLSDDGEAALEMFRDSTFWRHAIVRETLIERVMRRYASEADMEGFLRCAELLKVAPDPDAKRRLVEGFAKAIEGRSLGTLPDALSAQLAQVASELPLAMKLRIGAEGALADALAALFGETTRGAERSALINALGAVRPPNGKVAEVLLENLASNKEQDVQLAAIAALSGHRSEMGEASTVFAALESERQAVRDAAAAFLASELRSARLLVELAGEGKFELRADGVALIETLRAHDDATVNAALDRVAVSGGRTDDAEMVRVRSLVAPGGGVPKRGEALFLARCSACHEMFGNGGAIGPDLTSYQRDDREALLLAIIDPGAEIREGYEHTVVKLRDGGLLSGFRIADDRDAVVLRDLAGARRVIEKSTVDSIEVTASSLMPAGLLGGLSDDEVRDLFAYLRSTTPPY